MLFVALEHGAEDEGVADFLLALCGADGYEECFGIYSLLVDVRFDVVVGEIEEVEC